jgi:hypothetical protein
VVCTQAPGCRDSTTPHDHRLAPSRPPLSGLIQVVPGYVHQQLRHIRPIFGDYYRNPDNDEFRRRGRGGRFVRVTMVGAADEEPLMRRRRPLDGPWRETLDTAGMLEQ